VHPPSQVSLAGRVERRGSFVQETAGSDASGGKAERRGGVEVFDECGSECAEHRAGGRDIKGKEKGREVGGEVSMNGRDDGPSESVEMS
jgi:hypothetical protein